eukprot:gene10168-2588_t
MSVNLTDAEEIINLKKPLTTNWVRSTLINNEDKYTDKTEYKLVTVSWNVNSKYSTDSLSKLFYLDEEEADIYVIGLQEIDMTAKAMIKEETEASRDWNNIISKTFSKTNEKYYFLFSKQLVGIYIIVIIKTKHMKKVKDLKIQNAHVGVGGYVGNKGAIGCRFKFYDTSMCFLSMHLVPGQNAYQKRNQNLSDIFDLIKFENYPLNKHDIFVIIGDLNYRLNLTHEETISLIEKSNFEEMLKYDQLTLQKKESNILENFIEGNIHWKPTYKFDKISGEYDTERIPAFTDRILFYNNNSIENVKYEAFHEYMSSDHKPISAVFKIWNKQINKSKLIEEESRLIKKFNLIENYLKPQIKLSSTEVSFGSIILKNIGKIPVNFSFIPKIDEIEITRPWCSIEPIEGFLDIENEIEIQFTCKINSNVSNLLIQKKEKLEDILVLKVENAGDYFIIVDGKFIPSCFGSSIEYLCKLGNNSVIQNQIAKEEERSNVPKELISLIEKIKTSNISDLFIEGKESTTSEINDIKNLLDNGKDLKHWKGSINSLFDCLIQFLDSLGNQISNQKNIEIKPSFLFIIEFCINDTRRSRYGN